MIVEYIKYRIAIHIVFVFIILAINTRNINGNNPVVIKSLVNSSTKTIKIGINDIVIYNEFMLNIDNDMLNTKNILIKNIINPTK